MAIDSLKKNKAVGIEGISAEEIQAATTENGSVVLHQLCQSMWDSERVPDEGRKQLLCQSIKKKIKWTAIITEVSAFCATAVKYTQTSCCDERERGRMKYLQKSRQ